MKQLLLIAVALAAVNANASRARVQALGNSAHLVDTQTVYTNPAHIFGLPSDYLNFETGSAQTTLAATTEGANPEGMIVKSYGSSKFGLSLGHQSKNASSWGLRSSTVTAASAASVDLSTNQQNPIELTYGSKMADMSWAATVVYSNYNNTQAAGTALEKETSTGVRAGLVGAGWDANLRVGLVNNVKSANGDELKGTTAVGLAGGMWFDSMYVFAGYEMAGAKVTNNAGTDLNKVDTMAMNVGVLNSTKKDGTDLFYSIQLAQSETKAGAAAQAKTTTLAMPVTIGLEHAANSWLTLRGSVSQSTIINNSKSENAAGTTVAETAPGVNTTKLALGAGMQIGKVTFDGTLSTATTQTVNTTNLLAQAGLTYWF